MKRTALMRTMACTILMLALLATSVQAASPDQEKDRQLRLGGKGSHVTWFQKQLKKLGYYEGGISNIYNQKTHRATKDFQLVNGLKQTGIGDLKTRQAAFSKNAIPRVEYDKQLYQNELVYGSAGAQLDQYQARLVQYGYLDAPTGKFDADTLLATRYFQSANKLTVSSAATRATRALINKESGVVSFAAYQEAQLTAGFKAGAFGLGVAMVQQQLTDLGYYKGDINGKYNDKTVSAVILFKKFNNFKTAASAVSASDRAAIASEGALSYAEVYVPGTLKPGDKGAAVMEAQVVLRELKFYKGAINGKFGSAMATAVKKFQKANKLYPTGYLLSTSLAIIESHSGANGSVSARAYQVIDYAQTLIGSKYKARAAGPNAFDCSGFTFYVFKRAGISLGQSASAQSGKGKLVAKRNILPGDLVFFATGRSKTSVNHVGIVYSVENNNIKFVHSSSARGKVITSAFKDNDNQDFYNERFRWARRMW